jgi:hypothetical protein
MLPLLLCLEIDQTTITDTITVLVRCVDRGPENHYLRSSVQLASGYSNHQIYSTSVRLD